MPKTISRHTGSDLLEHPKGAALHVYLLPYLKQRRHYSKFYAKYQGKFVLILSLRLFSGSFL